ncbi:MAG: glutamate-5-semialdehyde dehydrogenase [Coriobacteriales bacterium]|jgi:glutamate-5-semialdehyde dehydrogenase|nr:glutamate-5-semialdehyde dehydrogenase [Coriobacteriales bacterium]
MSEVIDKAQRARQATRGMARLGLSQRNEALAALAAAIISEQSYILAANSSDMEAAQAAGTSAALLDRLELNVKRLEDIASSLHDVAALPDPLGKVLDGATLFNGMLMRRVSVPMGVVAMIYEARPNVTVDVAGLCLKTGNAVILRGSSMAINSNLALTKVLVEAGARAGLPDNWLQSIETTDRAATTELMGLHGMIDLLIPRGSGSLIKSVVENSKVPAIETGEGNCHLYIHELADPDIIIPIALNAKLQRPGVCNSIETVLIDTTVANRYLPQLMDALTQAGVLIHADQTAFGLAADLSADQKNQIVEAVESDWAIEYLALEIAIKCVNGLDEAIDHINTYGTHHSDAILSQDYAAVRRFLLEVDSASVYANASTRFTDGGVFGLGSEIGISTQKLHARGPMGLEALTTSKYIIEGTGQIR